MERVSDNIYLYQTRKGPRYMARVDHEYRSIRRKGFLTSQQAKDWIVAFRADLVDQKYFPARVDAPPLREVAESWLTACARKNLRHNTLRSYRVNLLMHVLPVLGDLPLNRITRSDLAAFVARKKRERPEKPYSRDALRLMLAPLSALFSDFIDEGRSGMTVNPCLKAGRLIKIKNRKKILKAFTPDQEAAILKACLAKRPDQYPLFCTLFWTGIRPGEAWALEVADLDLEGSHRGRVLTLTIGSVRNTGGQFLTLHFDLNRWN